MAKTLNILVLCTGNSARSVITEGLLNALGGGRVRAVSAGSNPTGVPNPFALDVLRVNGIDPSFARSKSWDEFAGPEADAMDLIITVCANAAGETCPIWPGHPCTAHWGVEDPAAVTGSDAAKTAAFATCFDAMQARVRDFITGLDQSTDIKALASAIEQRYPDQQR